jgi:hypothetical protein
VTKPVKVLALSVAMALLTATTLAAPSADDTGSGDGHPAIVWVGTVATDLLYVPAKLVYAGVGAVTGAFGWVLTGGDTGAAKAIWKPSMGGTYVVTPSMLEGKEKVRFSGS